jgi:mRNA interferase RelE/StbE
VARYSLRIKKWARKELESIATKADRRRIIQRIKLLVGNPRPPGASKLSGLERYRIRQGRNRILHSIEDSVLVIHVIEIGGRKNVYQSK